MRNKFWSCVLASCVLAIAWSGCSYDSSLTIGNRGPYVSPHRGGSGPPPHAPAHGYRRKHRSGAAEIDLVFDSGMGVYVVVGVPNHYYWDGHYLRIDDGRWYASAELKGHWKLRSSDSLPPGLRKKHAKHHKHKKHPGRGHGPAKGHW